MKYLKASGKILKVGSLILFTLGLVPLYGQYSLPLDTTKSIVLLNKHVIQQATLKAAVDIQLKTIEQGYFCKKENKRDKGQKMGLRMRLGNLDYVNKYEGKTIIQ